MRWPFRSKPKPEEPIGHNLYARAGDGANVLIASGGIPIPVRIDYWPTTDVALEADGFLRSMAGLPVFSTPRGGLKYRTPWVLNAAVDEYPRLSPEEIRNWAKAQVGLIEDRLDREARTCPTCGSVRDEFGDYEGWDDE